MNFLKYFLILQNQGLNFYFLLVLVLNNFLHSFLTILFSLIFFKINFSKLNSPFQKIKVSESTFSLSLSHQKYSILPLIPKFKPKQNS
jgi:hypothetical protein